MKYFSGPFVFSGGSFNDGFLLDGLIGASLLRSNGPQYSSEEQLYIENTIEEFINDNFYTNVKVVYQRNYYWY